MDPTTSRRGDFHCFALESLRVTVRVDVLVPSDNTELGEAMMVDLAGLTAPAIPVALNVTDVDVP